MFDFLIGFPCGYGSVFRARSRLPARGSAAAVHFGHGGDETDREQHNKQRNGKGYYCGGAGPARSCDPRASRLVGGPSWSQFFELFLRMQAVPPISLQTIGDSNPDGDCELDKIGQPTSKLAACLSN